MTEKLQTSAIPPVGLSPAGGAEGVGCNVYWVVARAETLVGQSLATETSDSSYEVLVLICFV